MSTNRTLTALTAVLLSCLPAAATPDAKAIAIFNFCVSAGAPSDEVDKARIITSGAMRREMTAGELMREAWISHTASKALAGEMQQKLRNRAIQYVLIWWMTPSVPYLTGSCRRPQVAKMEIYNPFL